MVYFHLSVTYICILIWSAVTYCSVNIFEFYNFITIYKNRKSSFIVPS